MDAESRQHRAWLIRDLTERIHGSDANCPPILAMWMAILTGITSSKFHEGAKLTPAAPLTYPDLAPADLSLSPFFWDNAPEWLGLDRNSAIEMLQPEHQNADWRAKANTPGYVSLRAISKMLERYAETGEVSWHRSKTESASWRSICEEHGIEWAAWQSGPTGGWRPPGTERIAIVKFKGGREPGLAKYDIAQQFSEKAGCNVHLISPDQISDRHRREELGKAEAIYGHPQ